VAIYGVVMNQAVFMSSLGDNALATGYKSSEYLYSCSAIILTNAKKGAAGLYHYPSGNIYDDSKSTNLIDCMIRDIRPTEVHVAYGTLEDATDFMKSDDEPSQTLEDKPSKALEEASELVDYLQGLLNISVSSSPATRVSALVKIVDGVVQYAEIESASITDLGSYTTGKYPDQGFKVYWKHKPYWRVYSLLLHLKTACAKN